MKLCMSYYGHENIPDAKLSPVALLVFEIYVTKFPFEERSKSSNSAIPLPLPPSENGLSFKKIGFYVQNHFPWPKIDTPPPPPNLNFSNF